ncbi:MAG: adenylyltransferase/cytidyltransferase family protein [Candidatus Magasanikbacteria bacterium]
MTKVMVFGTFDIIHPGHIHMFKEAKQYGDYLVIAVARDQTVCDIKGKTPKYNENIRLQNVLELHLADKVRLGCLEDKYQAIREEDPDIIALGYDQKAFVDNLALVIRPDAKIVRLQPYLPEIYKSSKMIK